MQILCATETDRAPARLNPRGEAEKRDTKQKRGDRAEGPAGCRDLNVLPRCRGGAPAPRRMVLGGLACGKLSGLDKILRVGPTRVSEP